MTLGAAGYGFPRDVARITLSHGWLGLAMATRRFESRATKLRSRLPYHSGSRHVPWTFLDTGLRRFSRLSHSSSRRQGLFEEHQSEGLERP